MASYPFARPDLWFRICPSHNLHTTNDTTITRVYFNNRRRQMAAHMKSDNRENNTTISSNMVPLFHLSFAFIYDYPPPPLHISFITKTTLCTSYWKLRMHGDSNNECWNLYALIKITMQWEFCWWMHYKFLTCHTAYTIIKK